MSENTNLMDMKYILQEAKRYEETDIAVIGKGFEVEFYPLFADDKINNLVKVAGEVMVSKDKEGQPFIELINSSEENFMLFIHFMMVREFTHLGEDMQDSSPSALFPYFEALVKTGYLVELVEDVFLPEEVRKVIKRIASVSALGENMNQLGLDFMEAVGEQKEKIENIQAIRNKAQDHKKSQKKKEK